MSRQLSKRERQRARQLAHAAIKKGRIKRQPCVICGTTNRVVAHHEDYSKPYEVQWLCKNHHGRAHAGTLELELRIMTQLAKGNLSTSGIAKMFDVKKHVVYGLMSWLCSRGVVSKRKAPRNPRIRWVWSLERPWTPQSGQVAVIRKDYSAIERFVEKLSDEELIYLKRFVKDECLNRGLSINTKGRSHELSM